MRMKLRDLRTVIREEYLRGVPEFVLRELTRGYVDGVRKHIQKHITMTKKSPQEAREAIQVANETLKELEDQANQLLEDKLWAYLQRT